METLFAMMPSQGGNQGSSMISTIIMFGAIFLIFYFMIIRPQQKRAKEREKMLSNLQKGDKIITSGGLHGSVVAIEDKTVLVQISDNVKVKYERSAIATIVSSKEITEK